VPLSFLPDRGARAAIAEAAAAAAEQAAKDAKRERLLASRGSRRTVLSSSGSVSSPSGSASTRLQSGLGRDRTSSTGSGDRGSEFGVAVGGGVGVDGDTAPTIPSSPANSTRSKPGSPVRARSRTMSEGGRGASRSARTLSSASAGDSLVPQPHGSVSVAGEKGPGDPGWRLGALTAEMMDESSYDSVALIAAGFGKGAGRRNKIEPNSGFGTAEVKALGTEDEVHKRPASGDDGLNINLDNINGGESPQAKAGKGLAASVNETSYETVLDPSLPPWHPSIGIELPVLPKLYEPQSAHLRLTMDDKKRLQEFAFRTYGAGPTENSCWVIPGQSGLEVA